TFAGPPRSILQHGTQGVLAIHSLSKRSSMRGMRIGFCAGDVDVISDLAYLRQAMGWMPSWPSQAAGRGALGDDTHPEILKERYRERLSLIRSTLLKAYGVEAPMPSGGYWLWARAPAGTDGQQFAEQLANDAGIVTFPGASFSIVGENDYDVHTN